MSMNSGQPIFDDALGHVEEQVSDRPLYFVWVRHGKIHWGEGWVEQRGPVRSRIPGLDDHVSFINHDLRQNNLPPMEQDNRGQLFVRTQLPLSKADSTLLFSVILGLPDKYDPESFARSLGTRTEQSFGVLNVAAHHGFEPRDQTAGLAELNELYPRQALRQSED